MNRIFYICTIKSTNLILLPLTDKLSTVIGALPFIVIFTFFKWVFIVMSTPAMLPVYLKYLIMGLFKKGHFSGLLWLVNTLTLNKFLILWAISWYENYHDSLTNKKVIDFKVLTNQKMPEKCPFPIYLITWTCFLNLYISTYIE